MRTNDSDAILPAFRRLPFVFSVGLEKCGTTSLNDYLAQAANVSAPVPKELRFFSRQLTQGLDWLLAHHDLQADVFLDCTPSYHWKPQSLLRIKNAVQRRAVVIMLRNPVARAYSAYVHRIYWFFIKGMDGVPQDGIDLSFSELADVGSNYVFASFTDVLNRVESVFTGETLTIPLELLISNPGAYVGQIEERLSQRLELPEDATFPSSNALPIPQFFTGREVVERCPAAKILIKDLDAIYLCRGGMPTKFQTSKSYADLKAMERRWMEPLDEVVIRKIMDNYYAREIDALEQRLGLDLESWRNCAPRSPRVVPVFADEGEGGSIESLMWVERKRFQRGDRTGAVRAVRGAIERRPHSPALYNLLSWMLSEEKDFAGAAEASSMAHAHAPYSADYYLSNLYAQNRRMLLERADASIH